MKRRDFLQGGAIGLAFAGLPALSRAFAQACAEPERLELLFDAYRLARREHKPLLVFVIPPEARKSPWRHRWGTLHGQALNHGDDATLAALAQTRLTAAGLEDLARLVELPDPLQEQPFLATIDTSRRPAVVRLHALPELAPPVDQRTFASEHDDHRDQYEAFKAAKRASVDDEIERISQLYRTAIDTALRGSVPLPYDAGAERVVRELERRDDLDPTRVLRFARHIHTVATEDERPVLLTRLAATMRHVLHNPVAGSAWARGYGCGIEVEGDEELSLRVGCGLGHVAAKSTRFLYFYTR